jgi:hypothetical protein
MFCDRCGTQVAEPARFCPGCGKGVGVVPMMPPPQGRIAGHVRLLGIFWLALSAFHLIPGLVLLSIFGHPWFLPTEVPVFVHGFLSVVGGFFLFVALAGILAGWGLLQREPWARTLAIVLGCFSLVNMPFGTALGIYTLWVLLPAASEAEYRSTARAA